MSMMTPAQTTTFICGVVMCIIGISTFVSALLTKARKDGQLEYKVDSALRGIDEIKDSLKGHSNWQEHMGLKVESHEEKIETLFVKYNELRTDLNQVRDDVHNHRKD